MECPCKNCICLPVCKYKKYYKLFTDCSLIEEYISDYNSALKRNKKHVYQLQKIMKPTRWSFINKEGWTNPLILSTHK